MVFVDIDPLKGLDNPLLSIEFEQWYCAEITVSQSITFAKDFLDNFA